MAYTGWDKTFNDYMRNTYGDAADWNNADQRANAEAAAWDWYNNANAVTRDNELNNYTSQVNQWDIDNSINKRNNFLKAKQNKNDLYGTNEAEGNIDWEGWLKDNEDYTNDDKVNQAKAYGDNISSMAKMTDKNLNDVLQMGKNLGGSDNFDTDKFNTLKDQFDKYNNVISQYANDDDETVQKVLKTAKNPLREKMINADTESPLLNTPVSAGALGANGVINTSKLDFNKSPEQINNENEKLANGYDINNATDLDKYILQSVAN